MSSYCGYCNECKYFKPNSWQQGVLAKGWCTRYPEWIEVGGDYHYCGEWAR